MPVQTFTFNKASDNAGGELAIKADVHSPEKCDKPLPVIIWFQSVYSLFPLALLMLLA